MTYEGKRSASLGAQVTVDGESLPPRSDLRNHSPDGLEWGYGGSGPSQLALAILAHHLSSDEEALELYQEFKWEVVARFPQEGWVLTTKDISRWVQSHLDGFEATVARVKDRTAGLSEDEVMDLINEARRDTRQ